MARRFSTCHQTVAEVSQLRKTSEGGLVLAGNRENTPFSGNCQQRWRGVIEHLICQQID
jgi:hypothetical protein